MSGEQNVLPHKRVDLTSEQHGLGHHLWALIGLNPRYFIKKL